MTATSDIFEHRDRRASREKWSQPRQFARRLVVDDLLIDELAQRLADKLAPLLIERLADGLRLTPEQLREQLGAPAREQPEVLVDAHEIARRIGRSRWWVYEHAGELGAVRLGSGSPPRLAFRQSRVDQYLQAATERRQPIPAPTRARPQRRRRATRTSTGVELLPIQRHDA